jgi:hypothetical protein
MRGDSAHVNRLAEAPLVELVASRGGDADGANYLSYSVRFLEPEVRMNHSSVRRSAAVMMLGCLSLLVACEDKRLSKLDTGITRDSALTVLGQGATEKGATAKPDSFPNIFTREVFIAGGKHYEVLYFSPTNQKVTPHQLQIRDSIPYKDLQPVVFVDNKMVARGWKAWDSLSAVLKLPPKKR